MTLWSGLRAVRARAVRWGSRCFPGDGIARALAPVFLDEAILCWSHSAGIVFKMLSRRLLNSRDISFVCLVFSPSPLLCTLGSKGESK